MQIERMMATQGGPQDFSIKRRPKEKWKWPTQTDRRLTDQLRHRNRSNIQRGKREQDLARRAEERAKCTNLQQESGRQ